MCPALCRYYVEKMLRRWTFNVMALAAAGGVFSLLVLAIAFQLLAHLVKDLESF